MVSINSLHFALPLTPASLIGKFQPKGRKPILRHKTGPSFKKKFVNEPLGLLRRLNIEFLWVLPNLGLRFAFRLIGMSGAGSAIVAAPVSSEDMPVADPKSQSPIAWYYHNNRWERWVGLFMVKIYFNNSCFLNEMKKKKSEPSKFIIYLELSMI